jgi:hypothetical protein
VHYLENTLFGTGARPGNLHYLMSFTDYIEVQNTISAEFSQESDVSYSYIVTETLKIQHHRSSDHNTNPAVYEEKTILFELDEVETGKTFLLGGADGVYTIYPKRHIDTYRRFVREQQEHMTNEDVTADRIINFSADLLVEFTFRKKSPDFAVNETLMRGIRIPLSNEVYDISVIGTPSIELSQTLREFVMPDVPVTALFALWFVLLILGIIFGIRHITMEKNKQRREVKRILKKYSDEVYISSHPADLAQYKTISATSFNELLKLAVNLNKQIVCFYNDEKAEFCAFSDGYAYICRFNFI